MQPKRPLPSKPLPSKPLPNKPLPSSSPVPPAQKQYSPAPPTQQQYSPSPVSSPSSSSKSNKKKEQPAPPKAKDGRVMFMPGMENAHYYAPQKVSSYQEAKKCEIVREDKNNQTVTVKLYQTCDKFFGAKGDDKNKGFQVANISMNEFGAAFRKMGVSVGWRVTRIGNDALPPKSFPMLKNQIFSFSQSAGGKGYELTFDGRAPPKPSAAASDDHKQSGDIKLTPLAAKSSVEAINCHYNDLKVIRIKEPIEKFVEFDSVKGPKGYKIKALRPKFGDDFKRLGIDVGWRLTMLGQQDVSEIFTQMIKSKLDTEWKNNKHIGVTLQFKPPL
mmetsp:Transcript_42170/g.69493  ORF Transcript_42170/g.69493 Transcript_42170/m.69493 type:complete len:330 (-) Transcript_42170:30-1019(-)